MQLGKIIMENSMHSLAGLPFWDFFHPWRNYFSKASLGPAHPWVTQSMGRTIMDRSGH
jgi:hypothetical protein